MGLIKEPLDVDFFVEPRSLTQKEREAISQHISEYKAKLAKRQSRKDSTKNKHVEVRERSANANSVFAIGRRTEGGSRAVFQ